MRRKKITSGFTPTRMILLSFLLTVLVGSLLLILPISQSGAVRVSYVDALFTATTATCVTGLVTLPTATAWSVFGQVVILILVQIGGLGVITVVAGLVVSVTRRLGVRDSYMIQDAFNLNTLSGLVGFLKKVILGTLAVEGVGAVLYMFAFVPRFGARGIWMSVFNSISAFCNAGMDVIGENSLCDFARDPLVNTVTSLLIILGGLGYIVWWDVIRVVRTMPRQGIKALRTLTLHTKIVLISTATLIFGGAALIMLFEYNNPLTIGNYGFFDKLQISLFQSVTTRTAGFATVPQGNFTDASAFLCMFMMFIGGSPVGTAGGVKTTTLFVLFASAFATVRDRRSITAFNRTITNEITRKAAAVTTTSFVIMLISAISLSAITGAGAVDVLYETVSATATVGLTRDLTPLLPTAGKAVIIITMYLGRVGPISLLFAMSSKKGGANNVGDPVEDISVG